MQDAKTWDFVTFCADVAHLDPLEKADVLDPQIDKVLMLSGGKITRKPLKQKDLHKLVAASEKLGEGGEVSLPESSKFYYVVAHGTKRGMASDQTVKEYEVSKANDSLDDETVKMWYGQSVTDSREASTKQRRPGRKIARLNR